MTENEKPKPDYLKWWLIFLTIVSGLIWLGVVVTFFDIDFISNISDCPNTYETIGTVLITVLTPIILFFAWNLWRINKRKLSVLFSFIQLIAFSFSCILLLSLQLTYAFGCGEL